MKPQIEELFKQIRKQKHTYNLMSNPPQIRYNYTIEEADIEKFAALIVKECVLLSVNNGGLTGRNIANIIQKHFGMDE